MHRLDARFVLLTYRLDAAREGSTERCALAQPRLPWRGEPRIRFDHPASGGSSSAVPAVAVLIIQPLADLLGFSARADAAEMFRMQCANAARRWHLQDRRLPKVSLCASRVSLAAMATGEVAWRGSRQSWRVRRWWQCSDIAAPSRHSSGHSLWHVSENLRARQVQAHRNVDDVVSCLLALVNEGPSHCHA